MENIIERVSDTLKLLRQERGWSLDVASQKTGVSKAMLGQIERKESSPTIATLWKIATGFDVSFSYFIEDGTLELAEVIHRKKDLKKIHKHDDKIRVMTLFSYDEKLGAESFVVELLPGCEHLAPSHQENAIEQVFVSVGEMEVLVDGIWHKIRQHEGLRFNGDRPHGYRNVSQEKVIFHDIIYYVK